VLEAVKEAGDRFLILVVFLQNSAQNSPGITIFEVLLKVSLESEDGLIVVAFVDEVESDVFGEFSI
jgi:hypothetical protein